MGLFKKDTRSVEVIKPAESKFDQRWSEEFDRNVFSNAGVDPRNAEAQAFLLEKRMVLIRYYGQVPMEKFGPRGAVEQWREYIASPGATPWGAMSLLVGHLRMLGPGAEEGILPQVEEKLGLDERDLAIDLAEKFGSAGKPDS